MKVFTPKGEYLCTAERVTETHPMAKLLGTVEDYKQKIQKPKIIFVDEIDYLMNNYKSVETLRDIHDKTDCPIVFVGMGLLLGNLNATSTCMTDLARL